MVFQFCKPVDLVDDKCTVFW